MSLKEPRPEQPVESRGLKPGALNQEALETEQSPVFEVPPVAERPGEAVPGGIEVVDVASVLLGSEEGEVELPEGKTPPTLQEVMRTEGAKQAEQTVLHPQGVSPDELERALLLAFERRDKK